MRNPSKLNEGPEAEDEFREDRGTGDGWIQLPELGTLHVLDGVALLLRDQACSLRVHRDPPLSMEAQVAIPGRSVFLQF